MPLRRAADFEGLLRALTDGGIRFIVIGGVSAALQGVPGLTYDLDIVLDPDPTNLDSALRLLRELEACYREHLPKKRLVPERAHLESEGAMLLMTRLGPLDILGRLATGWRYAQLVPRSRELAFDPSFHVQVLDLEYLIELKEALGREKDRAALPQYRRTLRELRDQ
jgi:hypothetical protein